uniref:Uncharacterized protein n=1 Tax=viral metagenome TaxID=1070528 RepID=A0A6C0KJ77_9ZZZZ
MIYLRYVYLYFYIQFYFKLDKNHFEIKIKNMIYMKGLHDILYDK